MKIKLLLALATCSTLTLLHAQEPTALPSEELSKAVALLMDANKRLGDLPLKLELAPDQATGFKIGEAGALLIPDKRLKSEQPAKGDKAAKKAAKGEATVVGQLWTSKIAPKDKDTVLANDKLRLTKITAGERSWSWPSSRSASSGRARRSSSWRSTARAARPCCACR